MRPDDPPPLRPRVGFNIDGIPAELRKMPHWVSWRLDPPPKPDAKPRKVPINPFSGNKADTTNFATWGLFQQAIDHTRALDLAGIGFVLTDSPYAGVDLDGCRDPDTGAIEPWAQKIIDSFATYTEVSPSGTGVKLFVRAKLTSSGVKTKTIEVYDSGRYFTVTGMSVPNTHPEIAERQSEIDALIAQIEETRKPKGTKTKAPPPKDRTDDDIIERIKRGRSGPKYAALFDGSTAGYPSASEADLALCNRLAFECGDDAIRIDRIFRRSGLFRDKWDEKHGEQTYGQTTVEKAIQSARTTGSADTGSNAGGDWREARALTDTGNSERLVATFGPSIRYVYAWKKWATWHNTHWSIEDNGTPLAMSKKVARSIYAEAAETDNLNLRDDILKWAKGSEKVDRRKAMVELAKSEPGIPLSHHALDRDEYLLNCPNGTLDLRTGVLRAHDRLDYITRRCPTKYVPDATCPTWMAFIERVLPDEDIRSYLQRFLGSALTGDVGDQVIVFATGEGQNGKSTLINAFLHAIGGQYAIKISTEMLLAKQQRNHPTELADLFKVRFAVGMETPKGRELDEPLVKELTGGDRIRARRMREDFWEFDPTHKLCVLTNHMPTIASGEFAMLRRVHRVRFDVTIPKSEKDTKLGTKLRAEREGILAWAVAGCREWMANGLCPPEEVCVQTSPGEPVYTPLDQFIDECTVRTRGARVGATQLFAAFSAFAALRTYPVMTQTEFGRAMGHLGYGRKKTGGVMVYLDIDLAPVEGWKGPEGESATFSSPCTPREEGKGASGPFPPQPSPNGDLGAGRGVISPTPEPTPTACDDTERAPHSPSAPATQRSYTADEIERGTHWN